MTRSISTVVSVPLASAMECSNTKVTNTVHQSKKVQATITATIQVYLYRCCIVHVVALGVFA
jgi:hypothetical protein